MGKNGHDIKQTIAHDRWSYRAHHGYFRRCPWNRYWN